MRSSLACIACFAAFLGGLHSSQGSTIFVDSRAAACGDGQTWATAHKHLQDALTAARDSGGTVTDIWVAAGTYQPDRSCANSAGSRDRTATFSLVDGVALRGGFAGTEDPATFNLSDRDFEANPTILSGDLANDDDQPTENGGPKNGENSLTVVKAIGLTAATSMDGFVVRAGNTYSPFSSPKAAGMLNTASSPRIVNCTFHENVSYIGGGGLHIDSGSPLLMNCAFIQNSSGNNGGAIHVSSTGSATLVNCTLYRNTGFGVRSDGGSLTATNCIIWANGPEEIYYETGAVVVTYSCVRGGSPGTGNISTDPKLLPDGRPRYGSSCIDAGNNMAVAETITADLAGHARFVNDPQTTDTGDIGSTTKPPVDMGAFEYVPAPAERLYVNANSLMFGDGTSWSSPYTFLQDAFKAADSRPAVTEIWVAAGTYKPDRNSAHPAGTGNRTAVFSTPCGTKVYGGFPGVPGQEGNLSVRNPESYPTILSGDLAGDDGPDFAGNAENSRNVVGVWGAGPSTLLDGFNVVGGNGYQGGGLTATVSDLTISNCVFRQNAASVYGGGVYVAEDRANIIVSNSLFTDNTAPEGGALGSVGRMSADRCTLNVTNCTFTRNTASKSGSAIHNEGTLYLTNSIVWGNTSSEISGVGSTTSNFSCTQQRFSGVRNVNRDPQLLANGRLSKTSPCIDAGDNSALPPDVATDLAGHPRFLDVSTVFDTGNPGTPPKPVVDIGAYEMQFATRYIYVKAGTNGGDGRSWATAYAYLQDAIFDALTSSDAVAEIWVARGVYTPDRSTAAPDGTGDRTAAFRFGNAVALYGGFPGEPGQEGNWSIRNPRAFETVLSGDLAGDDAPDLTNNGENSYHVVAADNASATATLNGCTITGGNADGTSPNDSGGGVYATAALISLQNCKIAKNAAATYGGGMYFTYGGPSLLAGCEFWRNTTSASRGYGGGLYTTSLKVRNCTFAANTAGTGGGGVYCAQATADLSNCILWGNTARLFDPQIYGFVTVTYSCIQGVHTVKDNISTNPLLLDIEMGDLRVQPGSPCIDAGSNAAVPSELVTDIFGLPRFLDREAIADCRWAPGTCGTAPIVDMGAHEFAIIPGDMDDDYDVDATDLDAFTECAAGPALALVGECGRADLDSDLDGDVVDFGVLQRCLTGENRIGNPKCAR